MRNNALPVALTGVHQLPESAVNDDFIRSRILTIRGEQVMLDRDLAALYGVETKRLNEQVKRNAERSPPSFRFTLSEDEMEELVAKCDRFRTMKHSTVPMSAFTELYHFGASLKDLGRHYCAVTKTDAMFIPAIMQRI